MAAPKWPDDPNDEILYDACLAADEVGIRLEMTGGVPSWEFHLSPRHQIVIGRILRQIKPASGSDRHCECLAITDMYIRFPDGSLKRPDISIFCEAVPETDTPAELVPAAVIEVLSPGFEDKDLVANPPFYLAQGVVDVIVVDPRSVKLRHFFAAGSEEQSLPAQLDLQCGCSVAF